MEVHADDDKEWDLTSKRCSDLRFPRLAPWGPDPGWLKHMWCFMHRWTRLLNLTLNSVELHNRGITLSNFWRQAAVVMNWVLGQIQMQFRVLLRIGNPKGMAKSINKDMQVSGDWQMDIRQARQRTKWETSDRIRKPEMITQNKGLVTWKTLNFLWLNNDTQGV